MACALQTPQVVCQYSLRGRREGVAHADEVVLKGLSATRRLDGDAMKVSRRRASSGGGCLPSLPPGWRRS